MKFMFSGDGHAKVDVLFDQEGEALSMGLVPV
jgi:hypothetical protein